MRQNKSIVNELASLLDRRVELMEAENTEPANLRDLIKSGMNPADAAQQLQTREAEQVQNQITLDAVCDRIEEVYAELAERLRAERTKRVSLAEQKLENDFLKWMSGDGVKAFADEQIRERVFIFSNAATPGIEQMNAAVSIPLLRERDFAWQTSEAVCPGRRELAQISTRKNPIVQGGLQGQGWDDLPRLVEVLRG